MQQPISDYYTCSNLHEVYRNIQEMQSNLIKSEHVQEYLYSLLTMTIFKVMSTPSADLGMPEIPK